MASILLTYRFIGYTIFIDFTMSVIQKIPRSLVQVFTHDGGIVVDNKAVREKDVLISHNNYWAWPLKRRVNIYDHRSNGRRPILQGSADVMRVSPVPATRDADFLLKTLPSTWLRGYEGKGDGKGQFKTSFFKNQMLALIFSGVLLLVCYGGYYFAHSNEAERDFLREQQRESEQADQAEQTPEQSKIYIVN